VRDLRPGWGETNLDLGIRQNGVLKVHSFDWKSQDFITGQSWWTIMEMLSDLTLAKANLPFFKKKFK